MKMTVIFEPDESLAITVTRETAHRPNRLDRAKVPHVIGAFRAAVDECVDRAMELGFIV